MASTSKQLISLAVPMAMSQGINVASGFLCMTMLAHLGHQILAASALISAVQMSVMVIGFSLLLSLGILVGHAFGAQDFQAIGSYVQQSWVISIILAIPIMVLFWHMGSILLLFHQQTTIVQIVAQYFHAYVWAVVPVFWVVACQQFGYGIQQKKLLLLSSFLSVIVLLVSAYLLIFGKAGLPRLGVMGLGYAMALQSTFTCLFLGTIFYRQEKFKKYALFQFRLHWHYMLQMLKIGWPICLQIAGEMLSFLFYAAMVGWLGSVALAAYQVMNQYLFLTVIPLFSLAQASGILIGHAYGAKQFADIKFMGRISVKVTLQITVLIALIFLTTPKWLAILYLNIYDPRNAPTLHLIVLLFSVVAFSQIFDGVKNVLTGALRGALDTRFPMLVGLIMIWLVGIPLAYWLGFRLHLGVVGIALGAFLSNMVGAGLIWQRWRTITQKLICA